MPYRRCGPKAIELPEVFLGLGSHGRSVPLHNVY